MITNEPPRPRLLLLAYYCDPNRGSEEQLGWNRALEAAKRCETWVITRGGKNSEAIDKYLRTKGEIPGLQFEFVPFPASEDRLLDPWLKWFRFRSWHRRALQAARRLHEEIRFGLIHHLTPLSFREPGYLWQLDVPFVWGPIGGTDYMPWRFLFQDGIASAAGETLRNVLTALQLRFSSRVRRAARRASKLLVANSAGVRQIQRSYGLRGMQMLDGGTRQVAFAAREPRPDSGPIRILWSGALVPRKALSLLLKALAKLPTDVPFELRILGEGEIMERRWKRLADRLGISKHIEWMGWLPHNEVQSHYQWADIFAFTSLRDTFGTVVLEAMSSGLPILCLDHQGVHDAVTERCGIKVPVTKPAQVVDGLRAAIIHLAHDPSLRFEMSKAALDRANEYHWPRLGTQMHDVYLEVLKPAWIPEQWEPAELFLGEKCLSAT